MATEINEADREYIAKTLEIMAGMLRSAPFSIVGVGIKPSEVESWLNSLGSFPTRWMADHSDDDSRLPVEFIREWNELISSAGTDMGVW